MKNQKPDCGSSNRAPFRPEGGDHDSWADEEARASTFADERFRRLLGEVHDRIGGGIPHACQDWAATKAAYRFFSNPRVSEEGILAGHFEASRVRAQAAAGPVPIMHDTTEFTYQRQGITGMGLLKRAFACRDFRKTGRPAYLTVRGMLMHSSMAFTLDGLPLGLTAIKFRTRSKFKGAAELKRHVNPTRIPIGRRRVSAGWRICGSRPPVFSMIPDAVFTLVTVEVTSLSCSARHRRRKHTPCSAPPWTVIPAGGD